MNTFFGSADGQNTGFFNENHLRTMRVVSRFPFMEDLFDMILNVDMKTIHMYQTQFSPNSGSFLPNFLDRAILYHLPFQKVPLVPDPPIAEDATFWVCAPWS